MSYNYGNAAAYSFLDIFTKRVLFRSFLKNDFLIRGLQSTGEFHNSLNKDVDLCYTFSKKKNNATVSMLLTKGISFTQKSISIPLLLRPYFHNMKWIYIIQVNRNCYDFACRAISQMDPDMQCKLKVANY